MRWKLLTGGGLAATGLLLAASPVFAQDAVAVTEEVDVYARFTGTLGEVAQTVVLDNIFIFICAALVFLMQAGFAMLAAGLTRAKNSSNMMMKSLFDAALGVLVFALVGWGIAYPGGDGGGFFGFAGWGVPGLMDGLPDLSAAGTEDFYPLSVATDFFFQAAFAATAATIVAGAVAERTKFTAYIVYTIILTGLIYPIVVGWQWGGGWLSERGFVDFAGSGLVHLTGGMAALMGAAIIGPRIGKYTADGKPRAIPGHSMTLAYLGVFVLFIGFFGFNPGSQLAADMQVPIIAVLTLFSGVAGALGALLMGWIALGKPDASMSGNGLLAGLVAICSGVGSMDPQWALVTGFVAGVIVVLAILAIDRYAKIDDPVGAIGVHGVCGFWGLLATGLFVADASLGTQLIGALAIMAFVGVTMGVLFAILKATKQLRVSPEEEAEGLDIAEHGAPGYGPEMLTPLPAGSSV